MADEGEGSHRSPNGVGKEVRRAEGGGGMTSCRT